MKTILKNIFFAAAACILAACQYGPVLESGDPSVTFDAENIFAYPGETVTVAGVASDPAGIRSIMLEAGDCDYFREIDLSKANPVSYAFSADIVIPEDASASVPFAVTVISSVSGTITGTLSVSIASDSDKPVFTSEFPAQITRDIANWNKITLGVSVKDNLELSKVNFKCGDIDRDVPVSGTEDSISEELEFTQAGDFTLVITVYDKMDNSSSVQIPVTVLDSDTVSPEGTPSLPSTVVASVGSTYALAVTFTDNVAVSYYRVYLYSADWSDKIMDEYYSDLGDASSLDVSLNIEVPATEGAYNFAIWAYDPAGNYWGSESTMVVTGSNPFIVTPIPSALDVHEEEGVFAYTLSTVVASSKGLASYRYYLYSEDWASCYFDETITEGVAGENVASPYKEMTFPAEGSYNLALWVYDFDGGCAKNECTVTVHGSDPVYLTLEQLPETLNLTLEDGIATHTLYMKGERTDDSTYTGVEFDLYDTSWTKLIPYGCANTWDWGDWSMYGESSYQIDKVITFDTAGSYYLYIGEKWGSDGYAGHQINITVE